MRADLERIMEDTSLLTIAFAVALGWCLFEFASGVGFVLVGALETSEGPRPGGPNVRIADRVLVFGPLLQGTIELLVVLAVMVSARRVQRLGLERKAERS